jgi:acetate kinase
VPHHLQKNQAILAVNIGSSSLKFSLYPIRPDATDPSIGHAAFSGSVQGLEPGGTIILEHSGQTDQERPAAVMREPNEDGLQAALRILKGLIENHDHGMTIAAVAHRVVHGGDHFSKAVVVTAEILKSLHILDPLAPLHQPHNLRGIQAFTQYFPGVPQVACFDTAFHADIAPIERTFPLTQALYAQGVKRYGFHGLSYHYISTRLMRQSPAAGKRLLMAHLGNGSSLCACIGGKSFSTTMGFSAIGGLMMGTRCGDLDPGVVLYLVQRGMKAQDLENLFYRESGLKGLSGLSADMRTLRQSSDAQAAFAIQVYTHRVIREAGGLIAAMGGVDAIAFAGGIGENDRILRHELCRGLEFLGLELDAAANQTASHQHITPIHRPGSKVEIWVVPTDEGIIAAEEALALL